MPDPAIPSRIASCCLCREAAREVGPELLDQQRNAVLAPTLVTDRIFDYDFVELRSVVEFDRQRIGDRALLRIVVILRELRVFHAFHLRAQHIDARVLRDRDLRNRRAVRRPKISGTAIMYWMQ